ncbi:unnamed protein product [Schistocephalus solidus]|uniref:Peptidase A2 domain-containing protein n=1 Tax=Schistocephalus solidus TaxID=70667 RepID=A0A183TP97_SCHSO|nr:unnamed protein product [Schistocephalus solidus]
MVRLQTPEDSLPVLQENRSHRTSELLYKRTNTNMHTTYPNPAGDGEAKLRMFSTNTPLQSPYNITIPMDRHPVKFEIDTGAAATLVNEASLPKVPHLLPTRSTFLFKAQSVTYAVASKVEEELDRLQKADIIEPMQYSEWAAPIVPVLKSDGTVRICGDYNLTINSATKQNPCPLPHVEDLYASLLGGRKSPTLNLKHAYDQVVLDMES